MHIKGATPIVIPAKAGIHLRFFCVMRTYYVYMMASDRKGTLYLGVTNDLVRRVHEHKNNLLGGFTKEYNVHRLVYWEEVNDITAAIAREKAMKKWRRQWKIELIGQMNPDWKDLYEDLVGY
jgi:putative endonuclease